MDGAAWGWVGFCIARCFALALSSNFIFSLASFVVGAIFHQRLQDRGRQRY